MARFVIPNHEQTQAIRERRPFVSRRFHYWDGTPSTDGVYSGYFDGAGDYVVKHWSTVIAIFRKDGSVWYNGHTYSISTSRFQHRILSAMTHDEYVSAARSVVIDMRNDAARYRYLHANRAWRERLARWESVYYTPERMRAA